jgi:site-specific DNA-methyltransferase (adenine-specific)
MKDYINITCEDNMALMARYPDGYFDLAIVDPPYGIKYDGANKTSGSHGGRKAHDFKGWDSSIPKKDYFEELFRVSKNQIIWGANYMTEHIPPSMGWVVWRKNRGKFSSSDAELAYTSFNRALREYTKNPLVLVQEGGTIHPTQKPICLYKWLLKNYAKPGDKILDTHIGSGSIAIAVDSMNKVEGMNLTLTGCELDPDYYADAMKRIKAQTAQQSLFQ